MAAVTSLTQLLWVVISSIVLTAIASAATLRVPEMPDRFYNTHRGRRVLMISFDGFRWNYLQRTDTPNFDRIVQNGVHARRGLKNAFVTKTFPNHYTLVSGLWEESHGIVANEMFDPKLNRTFELKNKTAQEDPAWFDVGAEPIWVTNQLQKRDGRSGVIMWPGGGAPVKNVTSTRFMPYDTVTKNETKMDIMINWFLDQSKPVNLGLIYFNEPDVHGHWFGPESEQITRMIGGLDEVVGHLLRRLEERGILDTTNIIITSDHGFAATPHSKTIQLDRYLDPSMYTVLTPSPIACIYPKQGQLEQVYTALKRGSRLDGHFTVYLREEIPERYHYKYNDRISPILAVAKDTYSFNMSAKHYRNLGDHGYDNELQDMHPFFVAMGPAFKKNFSVDTFNNVDVYPLLCTLLGLNPAPNNGSLEVVQHLLVEGAEKEEEDRKKVEKEKEVEKKEDGMEKVEKEDKNEEDTKEAKEEDGPLPTQTQQSREGDKGDAPLATPSIIYIGVAALLTLAATVLVVSVRRFHVYSNSKRSSSIDHKILMDDR